MILRTTRSPFNKKDQSVKKSCFIVCFITVIFPLLSQAAGFENSADSGLSSFGKLLQLRQQQMIGKTFYGYFDRKKCRPSFISNSPVIQRTPNSGDRNRYTADSVKRVYVDGIVRSQTSGVENIDRYYRVKIEDGSVGFMYAHDFRLGNPENEESLQEDCFFEIDPREVQAKLDKFESDRKTKLEAAVELRRKAVESRAKLEAEIQIENEAQRVKQEAISKRPGVRIGMTAKQVIEKSSWGEPATVNKIVTANGVDEQWVYGLRSYLYFKNGRLTAIQN
jgi:hypothetical protein